MSIREELAQRVAFTLRDNYVNDFQVRDIVDFFITTLKERIDGMKQSGAQYQPKSEYEKGYNKAVNDIGKFIE